MRLSVTKMTEADSKAAMCTSNAIEKEDTINILEHFAFRQGYGNRLASIIFKQHLKDKAE